MLVRSIQPLERSFPGLLMDGQSDWRAVVASGLGGVGAGPQPADRPLRLAAEVEGGAFSPHTRGSAWRQ